MPFISFVLNAVCEQVQCVFLVFPACVRTCSHGCSWTLFSYQEQGGSDYSFTLKWWNGFKTPFISYHFFFPPECSTAVHWFILIWMFASLIQWNEWHNQSSFAVIFFLEETEGDSLDEREEEVKIPWLGIVIKWGFDTSTRECQCHLQRGSLFTVRAVFLRFSSLSVAIRFEPYFSLLKRTRKKDCREINFQARVCKVLVAVC